MSESLGTGILLSPSQHAQQPPTAYLRHSPQPQQTVAAESLLGAVMRGMGEEAASLWLPLMGGGLAPVSMAGGAGRSGISERRQCECAPR